MCLSLGDKLKTKGVGVKEMVEVMQLYKALKQQYFTSVDNLPHILRDVFEVFVDTHSNKIVLTRCGLVTPE